MALASWEAYWLAELWGIGVAEPTDLTLGDRQRTLVALAEIQGGAIAPGGDVMTPTMNRYTKGNVVTLEARFTQGGTLVDPSTISLQVKDPTGNTTLYTYASGQVTKAATGVYRYQLNLNVLGTWAYAWSSTGAAQAAADNELICQEITGLL